MLELLTSDLVLKVIGPIVGVLAVIFGIYVKGRGDGARAVEDKLDEAAEEIRKKVKKAEKKVQEAEAVRRRKEQEIRDAADKGAKDLIDQWNKTRGDDE